ncbi:hypothetical protein QK360_00375 [Pseudomonas aeruginosa]|nr:hypothetical protein [Pseudomonas aeruginosa]MDI3744139.1 hypothetical protein [Pseudomonas aeruginosa]
MIIRGKALAVSPASHCYRPHAADNLCFLIQPCLEASQKMDKCLFCDVDLNPGSEEHIFLSALGARLVTIRATCSKCNNAFASQDTGKIDDALADAYEHVRNALQIWTGRNKPPPTIANAGVLEEGTPFDLAPGFMPFIRPPKVPSDLQVGSVLNLTAPNEAEVKRVQSILHKRKLQADLSNLIFIERKVPSVRLQMKWEGIKVWRCIAKSAVAGFVMLFGNERARTVISTDVRDSIICGEPAINRFCGWDFVNRWPTITKIEPHPKCPGAELSGFEHSLIITEVGDLTVAFIEIFGGWRFSVALGPAMGIPFRGVAVNPRSMKPARFVIEGTAPSSYVPRSPESFRTEHSQLLAANRAAIERVLAKWSVESHEENRRRLTQDLMAKLGAAATDDEQSVIIDEFIRKVATLEQGEAWESALNLTFGASE